MAEILGAATSATKFFLEVNQISIDNFTFKLFYKATTTMLLAFAGISTSKQFFGDPINCEVTGGGVNDAVLNNYCWMYSTFNIPLEFKGVCAKREHDGTTLYNSYYQWVAMFLVVCAVFFYMPRAIWLMAEGGLMKFLAKGTTSKIVEDADEKRDSLLKTFTDHLHNKYNTYALWFFLCEQLNFIVVLSICFITNKFLKYNFLDYGLKVARYYQMPPEERLTYMTNPMCETFPRIAACNYVRYGSGGQQETKNAICILGLNMINDKIFLVLWYWYVFLIFFGCLRFLYRCCQLSRHFRYLIMKVRISRYFKSDENMKHVRHYTKHCSIGDWFVLYQMSRNMNTRFFAEFLTVLSKRVNPCPGIDCHSDTNPLLGNGDVKKQASSLSLHSQIVDITYDSGDGDQSNMNHRSLKKKNPDDCPKKSSEENGTPEEKDQLICPPKCGNDDESGDDSDTLPLKDKKSKKDSTQHEPMHDTYKTSEPKAPKAIMDSDEDLFKTAAAINSRRSDNNLLVSHRRNNFEDTNRLQQNNQYLRSPQNQRKNNRR